jgi:hypothetical protein
MILNAGISGTSSILIPLQYPQIIRAALRFKLPRIVVHCDAGPMVRTTPRYFIQHAACTHTALLACRLAIFCCSCSFSVCALAIACSSHHCTPPTRLLAHLGPGVEACHARSCTPYDIAMGAIYLASDESRYVSSISLQISG